MGKKVFSNVIRAAIAIPTFGLSEVVGRALRPPSVEGGQFPSAPTEADAQRALEERKRKLDEEAQERRRQLVVSPIATGGLGLPGVLTNVRRSVLG